MSKVGSPNSIILSWITLCIHAFQNQMITVLLSRHADPPTEQQKLQGAVPRHTPEHELQKQSNRRREQNVPTDAAAFSVKSRALQRLSRALSLSLSRKCEIFSYLQTRVRRGHARAPLLERTCWFWIGPKYFWPMFTFRLWIVSACIFRKRDHFAVIRESEPGLIKATSDSTIPWWTPAVKRDEAAATSESIVKFSASMHRRQAEGSLL